SNNWLLAKICEVYVEAFRNVPLLLWLLLFAKFFRESLPATRQALGVLWDSAFLSNRGFYVPVPVADVAHPWIGLACLIGIAGAVALARWAKKRQEATGAQFPTIKAGLLMIVGLPVLVWLVA